MAVSGIIGFKNHKISCIIGHNPEEWEQEQEIAIDLKVKIDLTRCASSGLLKDTVDYVELAAICSDLAAKQQYKLMESLALDILERLFQEFAIQWAWIRIKKTAGLVSAEYTYVELERGK